MSSLCKYKFNGNIAKNIIEDQIALAITVAECTFGLAKVRINAGYNISDDKPIRVVIDTSTDIGENIAQVFTGLIIRQVGNDKFSVERVNKISVEQEA